MSRLALHVRCTTWGVAGALCGLAVAAYGQDGAALVPVVDPTADLLLRAVQTLGLPGVAAWVAWQGRALASGGLTVRLHPDDLRALAEAVRKGE